MGSEKDGRSFDAKADAGRFFMTIKTDLGYIEITTEVLAGIAGYAASLCFGVKGMTIRSMTDGLAHLLRTRKPVARRKGDRSARRRGQYRPAYRGRSRRKYCDRLPLDHQRGSLPCRAPDRRGCKECRRLRREHPCLRQGRKGVKRYGMTALRRGKKTRKGNLGEFFRWQIRKSTVRCFSPW